MRLCLVPMKPLDRAKQRLGAVLDPADRRALSLAMMQDVVSAGQGLDAVWVVCSDDDAADAAERAGATVKRDPTPDDGLNASLASITAEAMVGGAAGTLIVSADCPAATVEDVRAVALGEGVALVPDRSGTGTNALWRSPPDIIPAFFGPNSRRAHESYALAHDLPCAIVARERIALDVDTPRDLEAVLMMGAGRATRTVLERLGYPRAARR